MDKSVSRTFVIGGDNVLHAFAPLPLSGVPGQSELYYYAGFRPAADEAELEMNASGKIIAKSKHAPLIVYGPGIFEHAPTAWANAFERCKTWRLNPRLMLEGSTVTVRIGLFEYNSRITHRTAQGKTLLAVHIHATKPTNQAFEWLDEQIAERKAWFNG